MRPITLGVRIILIKDGTVLLVQHTYQEELWFLVGGRVQQNENLHEAAQREAMEEIGATLGDLKFLGIFTNYFDYKSDHVVVFLCEEFSLTGETDNEIARFAQFPLDALPSTIAAGHKRRIEEYASDSNTVQVKMW